MNPNQIHPNVIRQLLLLTVTVGLGYLLYREMYFMLGAFLGALALYMLMRRPMFEMVYHWKWPAWLCALLLILLSLVIIVLPLAWVINILVSKLSPYLTDTSYITAAFNTIDDFLHNRYGLDLFNATNLSRISGFMTNLGSQIIGGTLQTLTNMLLMYFVLWFMLVRGGYMERWVRRHLPLTGDNTGRVLTEVRDMVLSNTIGIPVLGVVQGIMAYIGYLIFEVNDAGLWAIMTGIASVIPFVGTMAAWVPLTILTFARGDTHNGIWLGLWGLVIIGGSDNVFRIVLQRYIADVHPLITLFGVIVGLNLFGFLGLIFGPLLISLFLLLVRIYFDEFVHKPHESGEG
jgi:predicted PurR-regulated permease PerM